MPRGTRELEHALLRGLVRVVRRVRSAPLLSTLLRNGVARRDARSERAARLQQACAAPGLDVRKTILRQFRDVASTTDDAFGALRQLNALDAALGRYDTTLPWDMNRALSHDAAPL